MADRLAGKVALVTGAGSSGPGIGNGKATATLFAREGAKVACVDRVLERAAETVASIEAEGGTAFALSADVTQRDQCEQMVTAAVERYGRLDILHNNVGVGSRQPIWEISEAEWDRVMDLNLKSMVFTSQAAIPHLEASGHGAIINIASIAGLRHYRNIPAYQVSKAGVIGLTISMAGDLGERGIRVNCIAPGQVWTPMAAAHMSPERRAERERSSMLKTEGNAWDIGWAAVYLASEEARWVTGQVLVIDAGVTLTVRGGTGG
ncbi:MAG: SDR family oxidoreductase [Chloroflexi bacterium]|nr:SDR family oxidoreductase [Chloroflexota bacterium]